MSSSRTSYIIIPEVHVGFGNPEDGWRKMVFRGVLRGVLRV